MTALRHHALAAIDWRFVAVRCTRVLAISWLAIFAIAYFGQRKLMYMPGGVHEQPAAAGLADVREELMATADGERVVVWSAPAAPGQPTILYFHGNGGVLSHRAYYFDLYRKAGYGVYAVSYRGFSGSTGSPTEAHNIADALAVYDLMRSRGIAARDIVLNGESIGSGVAVQVAAGREVAAVILESPYSSVAAVASYRFPYLPVQVAIRDRYDSDKHVQKVTAPILILACAADTVVPAKFARALNAAVPGPKKYVEYDRCHHVNTYDHGGFREVQSWIARHHRAATVMQ